MYLFNQSTKIGIVGLGVVGSAVKESMTDTCELVLVDNDPTKSRNQFEELFDCDGIFICVPSPQNDEGGCDTTMLVDVISKLKNYRGVIISKTTAPPDVYEELGKEFANLIHSPEFLTAANSLNDYLLGSFAIIGGSVKAYQLEAERIIRLGQTNIRNVRFCSLGEASLVKYALNSFVSTKLIFMNELAQLAEKAGYDYFKIAEMIKLDSRIGNSHMQVPGPDGLYGFSGACLPKDTATFLNYARTHGIDLSVLAAAVKKNTLLRLTEPK